MHQSWPGLCSNSSLATEASVLEAATLALSAAVHTMQRHMPESKHERSVAMIKSGNGGAAHGQVRKDRLCRGVLGNQLLQGR